MSERKAEESGGKRDVEMRERQTERERERERKRKGLESDRGEEAETWKESVRGERRVKNINIQFQKLAIVLCKSKDLLWKVVCFFRFNNLGNELFLVFERVK